VECRPQPIFCPRKARKARKIYRVGALTDEPALPKFLRVKTGFTQLRRRHPTPEAWHHEQLGEAKRNLGHGIPPPATKASERRHMNRRQRCVPEAMGKRWLARLHLPPYIQVATAPPRCGAMVLGGFRPQVPQCSAQLHLGLLMVPSLRDWRSLTASRMKRLEAD
jgi:hypothetical protein